jgi:hypothetical protein
MAVLEVLEAVQVMEHLAVQVLMGREMMVETALLAALLIMLVAEVAEPVQLVFLLFKAQ